MKLQDLPVITLQGGPLERGIAHGESLKQKIADVFGGWQYMVEKVTGQPLQWAVDRFCAATRFDSAMERWTPGLLEEIRGISRGSGVPFDALYMFNCTDENEWFLDYLTRGADLPEPRGCSSLGASDGEFTVIGQNMDIPGATDGFQVLIHLVDEERELETLLFSLAGMLGMIGVSNAPVGVVNNSLKQLRQRPDGLPVNAVVRGLLQQTSFSAAGTFITQAPHATGHNYIVAGPGSQAMYECSAGQVLQVTQTDGDTRVVHTNHPLANDDLLPEVDMQANRSSSNTHDRLRVVSNMLNGEPPGVDGLKQVLASHDDAQNPVCRHVVDRKTSFSAGAVIYELTHTPVLHLAPGPPCETAFGRWSLPRCRD